LGNVIERQSRLLPGVHSVVKISHRFVEPHACQSHARFLRKSGVFGHQNHGRFEA
jgi:hypothetical protein